MLWLIGFFIVFIIVLLIIIVVVSKRSKSEISEISTRRTMNASLESLLEVVKTEKNDVFKINETLETMLVSFPFPENKNQAGEYFKYVYYYAKNPLTTAKMIVQMQKRLTQVNPEYAKQIEDFQMRGIDARKKQKG